MRESARRARDEARQERQHAQGGTPDPRESARQAREAMREDVRRSRQARQEQASHERQEESRSGRGRTARDWADWASAQSWPAWTGWRGRPGERPWPQGGGRGWPGAPGLDAALFRDLERLAIDFARELRKAAWNTESVGENALGDLRSILEDALTRIKAEVFGGGAVQEGADPQDPGPERDDSPES